MGKEFFIQDILPLRERLLRYASKFLKDEKESEDIIQEVFIKLWCIKDTLSGYNNLSALAYRITKNLSLNRIKSKQYNESDLENIVVPAPVSLPDSVVESKNNMGYVLQIIDTLPSLQQAVIRMRHIEELEINEIAEIIGSKEESYIGCILVHFGFYNSIII